MSEFSMAFKSLRRRKLRSILTIAGMVAGIAMTFIFLSLAAGMNVQTIQMVRALGGADITVYNSTRMGPQEFFSASTNTLDESLTTSIEGISGVYAASPQFSVQGYIDNSRSTLNGIDPSTYSLVTGGPNIVEGSSLSEISDKEVLLGKTVADSLNITVGGNVILSLSEAGGETYKVTGIYETGNFQEDRGCYVTLSDAQSISNRTGVVTSILVKCVTPDAVSSISTAITNLISDLRTVTPTTAIQQVSNMLGTIQSFLFAIGLVALVAGSFGVVNTMMTSISERTREIGTLKAIGAKDGKILRIFLSEALLLGAIGGGTGVSIGIIVSLAFPTFIGGLSGTSLSGIAGGFSGGPSSGFTGGFGGTGASLARGGVSISPVILPSNILLCVGLGIVVGVLAGLYPAWRAARMRPVEALKRG